MNTIYKRRYSKQKSNTLTDYAWTHLEKERQKTGTYRIQSSTHERASLIALNGHIQTVNLAQRTCTCQDFQEYEMPCRHAQQVIHDRGLDVEDYISNFYTLDEYRRTYLDFLPPINPQEINEEIFCTAPPRQKKPERLKTARKRRKIRPTKLHHYSICGSSTHKRQAIHTNQFRRHTWDPLNILPFHSQFLLYNIICLFLSCLLLKGCQI